MELESTMCILGAAAALSSALALYLASPNRIWRPGPGRGGLRGLGVALALASLGAWIAALGVGPGLCTMLATWMLAMVVLPYLAWWTTVPRPTDARPVRADSSLRTPHAPLQAD